MVFETYALDYDIFYQNKDYKSECLYLKKLINQLSPIPTKTILDLGCGTGNYLIPLTKMGYRVTGVDASKPMLSMARRKLSGLKLKAELHQGLLQSFKLKRKYDAVICMFSVIDYVTKKADVKKTLKLVYDHLKPGGVFIFDFWQKQAVEQGYSKMRTKIFKGKDYQVKRSSKTNILPQKQLCEVNYHCVVSRGKRILNKYNEKHLLRYFSVEEMSAYLLNNGFHVLHTHPFLEISSRITKKHWDVTMVAQK